MKGFYRSRTEPAVVVEVKRVRAFDLMYLTPDGYHLWATHEGFRREFVEVETAAVIEEFRVLMERAKP
jgi:hypothetical protein